MIGRKSRQKQELPTILAVRPLDHHRLHIEFCSGSVLELNMEIRLRTNRYYDLNSDTVFRSAITDGEKIIFDTGTSFELEIFPRQAMSMARKLPGDSGGILLVQALESGRLRMEMKTGSILTLNMERRLHTIRYSPLKEPEVFQSVRTDGETLFFGDVLQIDEEELNLLTLRVPPSGEEEGI